MALGDEDLLQLVAQGDANAFAELYDRFAPRVFGLALKLVGDRQEAQDVLQEVFLDLWRRVGAFDAALGTAPAWILMITRGRSIDAIRKRQRQRRRIASLDPAPELAPASPGDAAWLERVLPALAPELRDVVHLAYARGMTREQIGEVLGIPTGTVKTRLRSAVAQMAASLGNVSPRNERRASP